MSTPGQPFRQALPDGDPSILTAALLPEGPLRPASARTHVEDDEMAGIGSADVHVPLRLFESFLDRSRERTALPYEFALDHDPVLPPDSRDQTISRST